MQKKKAAEKAVFAALFLLWMGYIFHMSAQPAVKSQKVSWNVGYVVGEHFYPGFNGLSPADQKELVEAGDHVIRKSAHFLEYFILGVLLSINVGLWCDERSAGQNAILAWLLGSGYACTDEIHQLSVEGRSGQISDVLLDSFGVFAGIILIMGLVVLLKKKQTAGIE